MSIEDIEKEISRLCSISRLSEQEAASIDPEKVRRFLTSTIVTDALNSQEYYREYRFTVNIPASMADEDVPDEIKDYPVILQGSVDLAIENKDDIIVVDYKTDKVNDVNELSRRYRKQLMLYKEALHQTFSKPVSKCLIYSIYLGEVLEVS